VIGLVVSLLGAFGRRRALAASVLALTLAAGAAAPARADEPAGPPVPTAEISAEIAVLRSQIAEIQARIGALQAQLEQMASAQAAVPVEPPPPTVGGTGGMKLLDLSFGGLFTAAASQATEPDLRLLESGGHDPKNRGVTVQNLEMTLSGVVDPYLRADANLVFQIDEAGESHVEVEEAYLTTQSLPAGLQVKAGTFFSSFGRLNPQHPHQWDFADQPVISGRLLGGDGLRGPGAQLSWLVPLPFYTEAIVGLQNAQGETAFSFRNVPGEEFAGRMLSERDVKNLDDLLQLGRIVTSFDVTPSFTLVPGISFVRGPNASGPRARTSITGVDLYGHWRPLSNDHGWPFFRVQAEWMERRYDAAAQALEDGTSLPAETLVDRGGYLQTLWGFRRRWVGGVRYDWLDGGDASDPLRDPRRRWATNVTFYPTEFSKFRLQYNYDSPDFLDEKISSLLFQFEYLYGAHGGHKF